VSPAVPALTVVGLMLVVGLLAAPVSLAGPDHLSAIVSAPAGVAYVTPQKNSTSWAGYVAPTTRISAAYVGATWNEPIIGGARNTVNGSSVSIWVGMDGWKNSTTLEQVGTTAIFTNISGVRSVSYSAWYDFSPNPPQSIPLTISANQRVAGSLEYLPNKTFEVSLSTVGGTFHTWEKDRSATRASAEWIIQASRGSTGTVPLAKWNKDLYFVGCYLRLYDHKFGHQFAAFYLVQVTLWTQSRSQVMAAPQTPGAPNSFSVVWKSYGP
jgi:hypothetical protein